MILGYKNKKKASEIINKTKSAILSDEIDTENNLLIKGDNINILKTLLENGYKNKIDLIYIDPPFATNNTFRKGDDRSTTISSSLTDEVAYIDNKTGKEFIEYIRERVLLLRELLSDKGSFYLHIDYKIGHYIKIALDEIFGIKNFRNDISRIKCNPKNFKRKGYGNIKDMVLFYTKTDTFIWNEPLVKRKEGEISKLFNKVDKSGRRYTTNPLHAPGETRNGATGQIWKGMKPPKGRHWRYNPKVLDKLETEGLIEWSKTGVPRKIIFAEDFKLKRMQDIWEFKDSQKPSYPTQKNSEMLELIIKTSSNADSVVMDSFCGSGSTLVVSNTLGRKWIGIDNSEQAIKVVKKQLENEGLFSRYQFLNAK